jgi:hypothetical protein
MCSQICIHHNWNDRDPGNFFGVRDPEHLERNHKQFYYIYYTLYCYGRCLLNHSPWCSASKSVQRGLSVLRKGAKWPGFLQATHQHCSQGNNTMDEGSERDKTWGRGGLPTLPGLYHSTIQPSRRGFFWVHTCVWGVKGEKAWGRIFKLLRTSAIDSIDSLKGQ